MNAPLWVVAPVLVLVVMAARADVRSRRIPNHLTVPALAIALASHAALGGRAGFMDALTATAIAGGVLLPGWLMGWMGAGDVKLMAAAGAWLGMPGAVLAVLAALVAGGVASLVIALRRGVLRQALTGAATIAAWGVSRARGTPPPVTTGIRFPFALAVVAGVTFALIARV
jgi:prepilin peptidase CpaA